MSHVAPNPSTQSQHPWRAAIRTGGATLLSLLFALAAVGPDVVEFVEKQWPGSPGAAIVASIVTVIVGLSILVNRVALYAPVTAFLTRIGAGPSPADPRTAQERFNDDQAARSRAGLPPVDQA